MLVGCVFDVLEMVGCLVICLLKIFVKVYGEITCVLYRFDCLF